MIGVLRESPAVHGLGCGDPEIRTAPANRGSNSTVITVTKFCFTYPEYDGLYSPPLNSKKVGKWLKTLQKGVF